MKHLFLTSFVLLTLAGCSTPKQENAPAETNHTNASNQPKEAISIVEFFDFNCAHCQKSQATIKAVKATYKDKISVESAHFPMTPDSFFLAEASECARDQDKFEDFKTEAFNLDQEANLDSVLNIAKTIEANAETFKTCLTSGEKKSLIQKDLERARKIGVQGTPTFLINGKTTIEGAYPANMFEKMIDPVLAQ